MTMEGKACNVGIPPYYGHASVIVGVIVLIHSSSFSSFSKLRWVVYVEVKGIGIHW